ncbi:MAG: Clp protease ClpP [Methanothrix sp.]|nr:MAG: Clp protease ClpP [Methanothrix sp.]
MSTKTKKDPNAKRRIGIVGGIVSGKSFTGWFGKYTGSESVLEQIGSGGDIEVYINSQGGSVFSGFEILNALKAAVTAGRKVDIYISPLAASIASYIAVGVKGAKVYGSANAKLMFHAPWSCACGSKDQLRDYADLLSKMEDDLKDAVSSRGVTPEDEWFSAGRMKWFSAKESLDMKLIDEIKEPPAELISAVVSASTSPGHDDDDMYDSAEQNSAFSGRSMLKIAANMEFSGYLASLVKEHYGEDKIKGVQDVSATNFEIVFSDDSKSLLNYTKDPLNIVNIEWESNPKTTTENKMKTPENKDNGVTTPKNDAGNVVTPGTPDGEAFIEGVTPTDSTPVVKAPVATNVKEPVAEKVALPTGMTEDMIAFAKESYEATKNAHVATIKANKENMFSDEELNALPMATIKKMANLAKAVTPVATETALKADKTIVKVSDKKDTGNVGTLPPPEL